MGAVLAAGMLSGLLGLRNSWRIAGDTITIVMLVQKTGSRWELALDRVGEMLLGIVIALAASTLVFPDRARVRLRDGLRQEFLVLGAFFEAILDGLRGAPSGNLPSLREDALAMLRGNNQLLQAALNQPSGGPGWNEGLNTLSQSGCSLFDAQVALEFSVEGSCQDGYAQQLEPALGKLAVDIRTGCHQVAGNIQERRFYAEPPSMNPEEDTEWLEERMEQVRLMGMLFSQAKILGAYAVRLDLKQIARMLRASRVETSRAVGEGQK
jgi:uncharacterized membrane protein YccC